MRALSVHPGRVLPIRAALLLLLIMVVPPVTAQPVWWSGNGHYYELVPAAPSGGVGIRWDDARAGALARTHLGETGYLVTITSAAENAFLASTFGTGVGFHGAWTGGHEPGDARHWFWADGPEAGVEYWDHDTHTAPVYANWGGIEPNDNGAEEDYMAFYLGAPFAGFGIGAWFDSPRLPPIGTDPIMGYIVEYDSPCSGCPGDAGGGGAVGLTDIAIIILCWGMPSTCNPCADLDGSGNIGLGDISEVIAHWAEVCR